MKRVPSVSVVVCCYNGGDVLPGCLAALKAQDYTGDLELIVVDDGSTDNTTDVALSFKDVNIVRNNPNKGLAGARNAGIEAATGEIIAFTDDDCRPHPDWISTLVAGYTDDSVAAVGGDVVSHDTSTITLRYLQESKPLKPLENNLAQSSGIAYRFGQYAKGLLGLSKQPANRLRSVYSLVGANMSFRRQALLDAGLFDERFRFGADEEDLCKRIRAIQPDGLVFNPKSKVDHQFEPDLRDTLRRSRAYGLGNARMFRKHADVNPIIYPFPILLAVSLLLGFIHPLLVLTPLVLVPLIYARWTRLAIAKHRPEALLYGYIQCLQEAAGNGGFIRGAWQYRTMFASDTPGVDTDTDDAELAEPDGPLHMQPAGLARTWVPVALVLAGLLVAQTTHCTLLHLPLALAMVALPGYLLLRLVGFHEYGRPLLRAAVAMVLGVAWIMLASLFAAAVLPLCSVDMPLRTVPLMGVYAGSVALLAVLAQRVCLPVPASRQRKRPTVLSIALYAVAVLLPVLSFVGASLLNNGRSNVPLIAMFCLAAAAMATVIVRGRTVSRGVLPALLFSVSLSAVWTYSLRSGFVFGWDIQQELGAYLSTQATGAWHVGQYHEAYQAMLSLTTLPVSITNLSGLSGAAFFKVMSPILFSLLPVLLYYAYRQFARRWIAFTAAALTIAQFAYLQEFSALVRQQIAFLFFALLMYALLQKRWAPRTRHWLIVISIFGVVVSHYSTTYATIALLAGVFVVAKLLHFFMQFDHGVREILRTQAFLKLWVIVVLALTALVWYGPVTHSNGVADTITNPAKYDEAADATHTFLTHNVVLSLHRGQPEQQPDYLQSIGDTYRTQKTYMQYYPDFGASNQGLASRSVAEIGHDPLLFPASKLADTALRYTWWLLAMGAAGALLWGVHRRFSQRRLELSLLVAAAPALFVLGHIMPQVAKFYNITRMNEHMLLLAALPAVLAFAWLFDRYLAVLRKPVIAAALVTSFAIAAGLVAQLAGGNPAANLNNYGSDYQRFYPTDTDMAAARWLAGTRKDGEIVYADRYAALRLTSLTNVKQNFFSDVTPESISQPAYVYADRTNIVDDTAMASYNGKTVLYQFPRYFLDSHKDLLYSNGQAEIYK
jgi:uncharacterized membrane protein/GT2 family glycosyltransferase